MTSTAVRIQVPGNEIMTELLGLRDEHVRLVESGFPGLDVVVRGNEISLTGDGAAQGAEVFRELVKLAENGHRLDQAVVGRAIDMVRVDESPSDVLTTEILTTRTGRRVRPKSAGQKRYVEAIADNVITFGLGPAGTGKTWLAVAMAVRALQAKKVTRIVLTRPAVEAGERLGFLPGDLMAKVDPYLRPLFDGLHDMLDSELVVKLMERNQVEIAPLAFMRGRTLNDSFIILDEAQNTTPEQMKMFLTRIGFGSTAVITGDTSQVDVPGGRSGLAGLEAVLGDIEGISFAHLGGRDIVRHQIVQRIVSAYEAAEADAASRRGGQG